MSDDNPGLTVKQLALIDRARSLAKVLVSEHPEIGDIYLTPDSIRRELFQPQPDISMHLELMEGRRIADIADRFAAGTNVHSQNVKEAAVIRALNGLVDEEERRAEFRYRRSLLGHTIGQDARSRGGRTNAKKWEAMPEDERKSWYRSLVILQGNIPWDDEENAYFLELAADPRYTYQSGRQKGKLNLSAIASELGRTPGAVNKKAKELGYTQPDEAFSPEEVAFVMDLYNDPEFFHTSGRHAGKPDIGRIRKYFNSECGKSKSISSISCLLYRERQRSR